MLRKALAVVGVLVLLAVPLVGRWLYYYQGRYQPSQVPHPDLASVKVPTPELPTFVDQPASPTAEAGAIVVDMAHDNRFSMAELNVLQSRLAARGRQLEPVAAAEELAGRLRYAQALVIISPGTSLTADEIQLIRTFVDKGGRLLLVADPTRYGVLSDDYGNYVGMDSDATHLNEGVRCAYGPCLDNPRWRTAADPWRQAVLCRDRQLRRSQRSRLGAVSSGQVRSCPDRG